MIKNIYITFFLVIFLMMHSGFSQRAPKRERDIFNKGVHDYQSGMYEKAEKNFKIVIERLPNSLLLTSNYLMLAKTRYKLKIYKASLQTSDYFLKEFPKSNYRDDIYFCKGNCYFRLERQVEAVENWLKAATIADDQQLKRKALNLIELVVRLELDNTSVRLLEKEADTDLAKAAIQYALAERYMDNGDIINAMQKTETLLSSESTPQYYMVKAGALKSELTSPSRGTIRIAALLPLSGASALLRFFITRL